MPLSQESTQPVAPEGYTIDDDGELSDYTQTVIHGTCSRCNHFHKHLPFNIPRDQSRHQRLQCEGCGHSMLGFGRRSTQTTLASAESIPIKGSGRPSITNVKTCANKTKSGDSNAHSVLPPFSPIRLNSLTISAHRPPIHSPLRTQEQPPGSPATLNPAKDAGTAQERAEDSRRESSVGGQMVRIPRYSSLRFGSFRGLKKKMKTKLCGKPRDLAFYGHGLRLQLTPLPNDQVNNASASSHSQHLAGPDQTAPSALPELEVSCQGASQLSNGNASSISGNRVEEFLPGDAEYVSQEQDRRRPLRSRGAIFDGHPVNMGRLSIIRREKTLKRQALRGTKCECTEDCPCKLGIGSSYHTIRRHFVSSSTPCLNTTALPSHYLGSPINQASRASDSYGSFDSARHLYTELIGAHLPEVQGISGAIQFNSTGSSSQSQDRFSQAPTARSN